MKTINIMKVGFTSKPAVWLEIKEDDTFVGVEERLVSELLKSMKEFFKNISSDDFKRYCCKVSTYSEDIDESGVRTNRVYY